MKPFQPFPDRPTTMSYYELPPELLEQPEELEAWARRSIAIACQAKKTKKTPKKTSKR